MGAVSGSGSGFVSGSGSGSGVVFPGVRVVVFYREPVGGGGVVEGVYREVSGLLAGTVGLLGNELLRDVMDPGGYAVASEWVDMAAFSAWDKSEGHVKTRALDPFQDVDASRRRHFGVYEVVARF